MTELLNNLITLLILGCIFLVLVRLAFPSHTSTSIPRRNDPPVENPHPKEESTTEKKSEGGSTSGRKTIVGPDPPKGKSNLIHTGYDLIFYGMCGTKKQSIDLSNSSGFSIGRGVGNSFCIPDEYQAICRENHCTIYFNKGQQLYVVDAHQNDDHNSNGISKTLGGEKVPQIDLNDGTYFYISNCTFQVKRQNNFQSSFSESPTQTI